MCYYHLGYTHTSIVLRVKNALWLFDFIITSLIVTDPPVVVLSIEPRSVLEGERVTFTCQATANPPVMGYKYVSLCSFLKNNHLISVGVELDIVFFTFTT